MTGERIYPPYLADERTNLENWLEWQRATLAKKCAGLSAEQLRKRSVAPSVMSLIGLVRHMAEVEHSWFQRCLAGKDEPLIYCTEEDPDADFEGVDRADPEADIQTWHDQCALSRRTVSGLGSLDDAGTTRRSGDQVSARWVIVHMIEEYARHNGHADLLRERIDGKTGY
ncbi:MAG: DinB family protein [Acidimicrobiales bacterium]